MIAPQSSVADAEDPLAGAALFDGMTQTQRARIASLVVHREVEPGTVLVREGDPAGELLVIQRGSVDITKRVAGTEREQRIATLEAGTTLGEMTLLDRAPRSATARATTTTRVGILSMDRLQQLGRSEPDIERQLLGNLSKELSRRLRFTNDITVAALERQLALEKTRAIMGRFVVFMAFLMVTYTFALYLATSLLSQQLTSTAITLPLTLVWAGVVYGLIRRSGLPFEAFGLTLRNRGPVIREALIWTTGICVGATAVKLGLIWWNGSFAGERLFNLSGVLDPETRSQDLQNAVVLALAYGVVAPVQEFICKSGLQASLQRCLVGPSVNLRSVVISNALFASGHLHLSLGFAIFAFFPGLIWGALFARQQSLLGVCVSHLLCGWFAFLVLGFEPWY
jgi:CRP-like cAMP-binding protein